MKRSIFLIGMPASGKTRIGKELADIMGVPVVDTDAVIENECSISIMDYFAAHGEATFRQHEAKVISRLAADPTPQVICLGGGAVETPQVRRALRDQDVVYLQVSRNQCIRNLADDDERPLMQGVDVAARVDELRGRREGFYRELATITHNADKRDARAHAQKIAERLHTRSLHVRDAYDVLFGHNIVHCVNDYIADDAKVLIIHPPALDRYATNLGAQLTTPNVFYMTTKEGEAQKTSTQLIDAWDVCAANRLGRDSVIIGLGGGATTDFAGFVAATWLRGVDFISIPTSVLAMVDAGIGGKTGINISAGKNLVGSFYPPKAVIADFNVLATLPRDMVIEGMGEVIKCGFIASDKIISTVECYDSETLLDVTSEPFEDIVVEAARVKVDVVSEDLKEAGRRENLNYGHTFAHALEQVFDYSVAHGQAVAVGMMFAAKLGHHLGYLSSQDVDLHQQLLSKLHLYTTYRGAAWDDLYQAMLMDKKVRSGKLRFVVLRQLYKPTRLVVEDVSTLRDIAHSLVAADGCHALEKRSDNSER